MELVLLGLDDVSGWDVDDGLRRVGDDPKGGS
jgi:hypothetical protein